MKTLGIIAEYNPFHTGHAYHIGRARELSGCDKVVVVMSGNFVQRGEPACMPTYLRTRSALQNGADMVVQLPVEYCTGSAGDFARGGIAILEAMGVDAISFGVENEDISSLKQIAEILLEEPENYRNCLKAALKSGLSFPASREQALRESGVLSNMDPDELHHILTGANNILGIEYLMALRRLGSRMEVYPVKRLGQDYHDARLNKNLGFNSASALRDTMALGSALWMEFTPFNMQYYYMISMNKALPVFADDFSLLMHESLLKYTSEQLTAFADVDEALADRIVKNRDSFMSFTQFAGLLKNKAYTYSRISRALMHILLEIPKVSYVDPLYTRVLGVRNDSEELIGYFTNRSSIPLITNINAPLDGYSPEAVKSIELNQNCDRVYNSLMCNKFKTPYRNENKQFFLKI